MSAKTWIAVAVLFGVGYCSAQTINPGAPSCTILGQSIATCSTAYTCSNNRSFTISMVMSDTCPVSLTYNNASTAANAGETLAGAIGESFVGIYPVEEWQLRDVVTLQGCTGATPTTTVTVYGTCSGPNEGCG
jgi:hypothetical protein